MFSVVDRRFIYKTRRFSKPGKLDEDLHPKQKAGESRWISRILYIQPDQWTNLFRND